MPADYVLRGAAAKAQAVAAEVADPEVLVIGADTAVVLGDEIFGKPADRESGVRMLTRLGGVTHEVYTGVAVAQGPRCVTALSRSEVRFRPVTRAEATAYWATGEPRDKAGGYAIQGLGAVFVECLRGSYSGVMGLPLFESARLLESFGYRVLGAAR
jgi:septum formation protein